MPMSPFVAATLTIAMFATAPAAAQTRPAQPVAPVLSAAGSAPVGATYLSNADLKAIENRVPANAPAGRPAGFSKRLFSAPNYSDAFIRIATPDKPHAHGRWSEVYIVVDGSAVLETGGTIVGAVEGNSAVHGDMFLDPKTTSATPERPMPADPSAPKDLAGVDIAGGHRQTVGPGDVILIPAGVPHRWVSVERPVVYHDVKFPR